MRIPPIIVFLVLTLPGCAIFYPEQRIARLFEQLRFQWVIEHRTGLHPDVARAIVAGRVIPGMTAQEARAAWMQWVPQCPCEDVTRIVVDGREVYAHLFTGVAGNRAFYTDEDDRVVAVYSELTDAEIRTLGSPLRPIPR